MPKPIAGRRYLGYGDAYAAGTAGVFAGAFCAFALFKLGLLVRGRGTWLGAGFWCVLALLSLVALLAVAFATRLTG